MTNPLLRLALLTASVIGGVPALGCDHVAGLEEHEILPTDAAPPDDVWHMPAERCNFRDDDYDGLTDEGYGWVLGDWTTVYSDTDLDTIRAARMPNGRVAYAVSKDDGQGAHSLFAGMVNIEGGIACDGRVVATSRILYGWDVAVDPLAGEIGLAYVRAMSGHEDCDGGCLFEMLSFDGDLEPTRAKPALTSYPRHRVHQLFDLDWTTAGYVTMTKDQDGYAWIEWIDQMYFTFPNNAYGKLAGIRPERGRIRAGPGVAWAAEGTTDTDRKEVWVGIVSSGGYRTAVEGRRVEVDVEAGPLSLATGQPVAWLPAGALLGATSTGADLVLSTLQTGATGLAGVSTDEQAHSVVAVGTSLLLTSGTATRVSLRRVEDVSRVEALGPFEAFDGTRDHALVVGGHLPMVLRVTGARTRVEAAVLVCEEE